jgi:hypothetical protein
LLDLCDYWFSCKFVVFLITQIFALP